MLRSTLIFVLLAFSASASAEGFSYNYLTLGYGNTDFDGPSGDGDGFSVSGSYAITGSIHTFAGFDTADLDTGVPGVSVDADRLRIGVGYNTGLTDTLDAYARLSYESIDAGASDDSGYGLGVGVRFRAMDELELNAGIKHVDYGNTDYTSLELGGVYSFNDTWSLGLHGEFGDVSTYTVSGRFYFGQ